MPGMNGAELARSLSSIRSEMKVLFMSGYTDDALIAYGVSDDSINFITKPFSFDQLNAKVREVLDSGIVRDPAEGGAAACTSFGK